MPLFQNGANYDLCWCNYEAPGFNRDCHFAFLRYDDEQAYLVVCNFGGTNSKVTIYYPDELKARFGDSVTVSVKAYDAVIKNVSLH